MMRHHSLAGHRFERLDAETKALIGAHGIRNGLLTSIAPTGTISLLAGNVSSGIEPVFDFTYTRKILAADGSVTEEAVEDPAYRQFRAMFGPDAALPSYFVSAQELSPREHLRMQAALQRACRCLDLQDGELPRGSVVPSIQGPVSGRLCDGSQGLHRVSAEFRHRERADHRSAKVCAG